MIGTGQHALGFGGGGAFAPSDIAALEAWYRSDLGVTKDGSDFVSDWADQSGNNRDLAEGTNKPLWVDALVNGRPAIRFDGSNDILATGAFTVTQAFHAFVVVKQVAITDVDRIYALDTDAGAPTLRQETAGGDNVDYADGAAVGPDVSTDTTNFHLYAVVANGTSTTLAKDDDAPSGNASNFTGDVAQLTLGARGDAANFGNVEIAEFVLYGAELTGDDLTALKNYFNQLYNLW